MRNDRPEPHLIEPCPIAQTYCDGLASVEIAKSGNAHLTLYAEQRDMCEGSLDRIVVVRLVIPQAALMEAVAKIVAAHGTPADAAWASQAMGGRA